jgi:TPP-dependent trihydroxycyclohexane-1,2-dione (THcHDO) dehydratase
MDTEDIIRHRPDATMVHTAITFARCFARAKVMAAAAVRDLIIWSTCFSLIR